MKTKRKPSLLRKLAKIATLFFLLAMVVGFCYLYLTVALPDVSALKNAQLQVPLKIYSRDGKLLGEFGEMQRTPLTLDQIPSQLIDAVLATEDQRFYDHGGIDVFGLMRAAMELLMTGTKSQGGSTITMQVARNFYLSRQKTFARKIDEVLLAMKIDQELSKEKILELYLNKIYLGKRAYGVAAAAEVYYGKSLSELTLPELAMIAGLPKAPSTINPITNPIAAKNRRDHVLERMYELKYIDREAYEAAVEAPITARYYGQPIEIRAPYVAEMVRNLMLTSFGSKSYTEGYKVYTTVDSRLQEAANQALRQAILAYDQRHGYYEPEQNLGRFRKDKIQQWQGILDDIPTINGLKPAAVARIQQDSTITALLADGDIVTITPAGFKWTGRTSASSVAKVGDVIRVQQLADGSWQLAQEPEVNGAIVAINPYTSGILALVGGFDYQASNYNRVTQTQRQPGSSFKPFIYAAAIDKGFTLATRVNDSPITYVNPSTGKVWQPRNDNRQYLGPTRLREALARSVNMVSIRLLQSIGVKYAINYFKNFGFDTQKIPAELSIALGSAAFTPLEMAAAYAVFSNGGYQVSPYIIDRVEDAHDNVLYQAHPHMVCGNESGMFTQKDFAKKQATSCAKRAISQETAFLMTSAMQEVVRSGTGRGALVLNRQDIAGKTGTSNDTNDAWFSGFNSDIAVTTWVGYDQPEPLREHGSQAALPMWIDFMRVALEGKPEHTMAQPPNVTSALIDPYTGLLARDGQENAIVEYFRDGTVPTTVSTHEPPPEIDETPDASHEPGVLPTPEPIVVPDT